MKIKLIDVHAAFGGTSSPKTPCVSKKEMLSAMKRLAIARVVARMLPPNAGDIVVAKEIRNYPGRIEGYISLWPDSSKNVLNEIKRCLKLGFGGIKLHTNKVRYNDPVYASAWETANERHLPVLMHTWGDEPTMGDLRTMAEKYPGAVLLAGHSGAGAEEKYIALAKELPNVYLELCYSQGPRGLVERFVQAVGAEKIVFGSDALFYSLHHQVGKVVGANIGEREKKLILGRNAACILAARKL